MPHRPLALLWTNEAPVYAQALAHAGLAEQLDIRSFRLDGRPGPDVLDATELMLAWPVPPGTLARMPRLRWIQTLSVGVEGWLDRPDLRVEIALTCARGIHRVQMPENILAALFHLTKHFATFAANQREHRWARRMHEPLAGRTLGILGLGTIGRELARKAAALELRVIGVKRAPETLPHVARVYSPEATDEVLAQADFVLLLMPLTRETDGFMNARRLAAMKPSAYLLNFARGGLIVDDDLVAAVKAKTIAGAVLDVFRTEPLPAEHSFWSTAGILVLPHVGGGHPRRDEIAAELFVDNARRFLAGEPLAMQVDRARGY
jgi:phosphoglycerate dehydrogenase-like enzyme